MKDIDKELDTQLSDLLDWYSRYRERGQDDDMDRTYNNIKALIATQVTKARIDELEHLWSDDIIYWCETSSSRDFDKAINIGERIAKLRGNK